jgi:hypothetical protein
MLTTPFDVQFLLKGGLGSTNWYDIPVEKRAELILSYIHAEAIDHIAESITKATNTATEIYAELMPEVRKMVAMMERVVREDYPVNTSVEP